MDIEELKIRLKAERRIYEDSPNVTATYIDLARVIEALLIILETKKIEGFKHGT